MLFRMNNLRVGLESRRTLEEAAAAWDCSPKDPPRDTP